MNDTALAELDIKQAVDRAKQFVSVMFDAEQVINVGLEEIEHDPAARRWLVTIGFSRPWNTPRSRTQEIVEQMGGISPLKRTYKVVTVSQDGSIISMKNLTPGPVSE